MNRKLQNKGDVILIESEVRLSGRYRLSNFIDNVASSEVLREFRFSIDGLFWNDWVEINIYNLSQSLISSESYVVFQVRYTKTKDSAEVTIGDFSFFGIRVDTKSTSPAIESSQFGSLWNTIQHKQISQNLFKKLYFRGILPEYIKRAENRSYNEDSGFIDLFMTVAKFFGLLLMSQDRLDRAELSDDVLREYVTQNGVFINDDSLSTSEMKALLQNYLSEIRKRGTSSVFSKVNGYGEFLRIIKNFEDEFIMSNLPLKFIGWNIGNSSPLYRGLPSAEDFIKTKTKGGDFKSISDHVVTKGGDSETSVVDDGDRSVLRVHLNGIGSGGLGRIEANSDEVNKESLILIDSRLDYEVSFQIKVTASNNSDCKIVFGVEGFNSSKFKLHDSFIDSSGQEYVSETFMELPIYHLKKDVWYKFSGVLRGYSCQPFAEDETTMGVGRNLIFNNQFVKYISPNIQLISTTGESSAHLWGFSLKPLVWGNNIIKDGDKTTSSHSMGFIQSSRVAYMFIKNNNQSLSKEDIDDMLDKYFLPYNQSSIITIL